MHKVVFTASKGHLLIGAPIKGPSTTITLHGPAKTASSLDMKISRGKLGRRLVFTAGQKVILEMKGTVGGRLAGRISAMLSSRR